jgi:uncharacterized membrane protein
MSNHIAVAYDDVDLARDVLRTLNALSVERAITMDLREALSAPAA